MQHLFIFYLIVEELYMDKLYKKRLIPEQDFEFGEETAKVFDDMMNRNVPFYDEIQNMIEQLVKYNLYPGSNVYDLGCSTGTTLIKLASKYKKNDIKFIGIDSSEAMLNKARENLKKHGLLDKCILLNKDLNKEINIENASAVILNLSLHFIRPINRDSLISQIHSGLREKGCLILVEKILSDNPILRRGYIEFYHNFKEKNNYSKLEIQQKRIALENILIPYSFEENCKLLRKNGFNEIEEFFRWYCFCGIISFKK